MLSTMQYSVLMVATWACVTTHVSFAFISQNLSQEKTTGMLILTASQSILLSLSSYDVFRLTEH